MEVSNVGNSFVKKGDKAWRNWNLFTMGLDAFGSGLTGGAIPMPKNRQIGVNANTKDENQESMATGVGGVFGKIAKTGLDIGLTMLPGGAIADKAINSVEKSVAGSNSNTDIEGMGKQLKTMLNKSKGIPMNTGDNSVNSTDLPSGGVDDVPETLSGTLNAAEGGAIYQNSMFSRINKSGMTHGPGGPKQDMVPAKLDGGFVIPAEFVDGFFKSGAAEKLGLSKHKPAHQNQPGGDDVHISPGEYYVDQQHVQLAKKMGIDLNQFAPNAQNKLKPGAHGADGLTDGSGVPLDPNTPGMLTPKVDPEDPERIAFSPEMLTTLKNQNLGTDTDLDSKAFNPFDNFKKRFGNLDNSTTTEEPNINTPNAGDNKPAAKPGLTGLYRKVAKPVDPNADPMAKKYSMLNNIMGAENMGIGLAGLITNLTRKYQAIPLGHVAKPDLYNTELDTREEEEAIKTASNTARTAGRNAGVNPMQLVASTLGTDLQATEHLSEEKQRFRTSRQDANTGLMNEFRQRMTDEQNKYDQENAKAYSEFKQEKANAVMASLGQLSQSQAQWMNNMMKIDEGSKSFGLMKNAIAGTAYKAFDKYQIPPQSSQNIFNTLQKYGFDIDAAAKGEGWKLKQ